MNSSKRFTTKEPTLCAVCRRHAWHVGYAPRQNAPIIWLCDSLECASLGRKVYNMPQSTLDLYEEKAARAAGEEAGAYLDEIGQTDLAGLSGEQWNAFLTKVIVGYERNLRNTILSGEAPF